MLHPDSDQDQVQVVWPVRHVVSDSVMHRR